MPLYLSTLQGLHVIVQGLHVTSANVDAVIKDVLQKLQRIESSLTVQQGLCLIGTSSSGSTAGFHDDNCDFCMAVVVAVWLLIFTVIPFNTVHSSINTLDHLVTAWLPYHCPSLTKTFQMKHQSNHQAHIHTEIYGLGLERKPTTIWLLGCLLSIR